MKSFNKIRGNLHKMQNAKDANDAEKNHKVVVAAQAQKQKENCCNCQQWKTLITKPNCSWHRSWIFKVGGDCAAQIKLLYIVYFLCFYFTLNEMCWWWQHHHHHHHHHHKWQQRQQQRKLLSTTTLGEMFQYCNSIWSFTFDNIWRTTTFPFEKILKNLFNLFWEFKSVLNF